LASRARIEIIDFGTDDWAPAPSDPAGCAEDSGRGLVVVAALAELWGHAGGVAWPRSAGGKTSLRPGASIPGRVHVECEQVVQGFPPDDRT
jgi:hypothetical protein